MVYTLSGVRLPAVPSAFKLRSDGSTDKRSGHFTCFMKTQSHSRMFFSGKIYESRSQFSVANATGKVLVPGTESEGSSVSTEKFGVSEMDLDDSQISSAVESLEVEHVTAVEDQEDVDDQIVSVKREDSASVQLLDGVVEAKGVVTSEAVSETIADESARVRARGMPPPGTGQRIYEIDPLLHNYREHLDYRYVQYKKLREAIEKFEGGLEMFSRGYEKLGFTRSETGITYREWAPGAKSATLIGDFNN